MQYLFATVILAGILQIVLGALGVAKLMRFVPRSVTTGFVNALAILICVSQLPDSLPSFLIPDVPFAWETLEVIAPYALAMAVVGLLESLMTAKLVDDVTDTRSDKTRESLGRGGANILAGFFGGMGGCAMIGQTMINVQVSGARTQLSTFTADVLLMVLSVALVDLVAQVPMAALVAVMIFVAWSTSEWHSIRPATLRAIPKSDTAVMLVMVIATVATNNLATGVGLGVLTAMVLFARRVAHFISVRRSLDTGPDGGSTATYTVDGKLFWASSNDLYTQFEYVEDPDRVVIDLSGSHVWDASTVASLDAITEKYECYGKTVEVLGLNSASASMRRRLSGKLAPEG